jgi:GNAT superfamily N-acetyltransferase
MIKTITWNEISPIWRTQLWPNRTSPIETNSAMCYLKGHDMFNMSTLPTFFGYIVNDKIVGVNSGHPCVDNYRSRGLWVDPAHRNQGIGRALLKATIDRGLLEGFNTIWSYPRSTSWSTYKSAGFKLSSDWQGSETSESNAYCYFKL